MKRSVAVVAMFVLASFLASALFSRVSVQPNNTQDQLSGDYDNTQSTNAAQNRGASTGLGGAVVGTHNGQSNQTENLISSADQSGVSNDDSWLRHEGNPNIPVTNDVTPPDGAIFYGGEPPYAYIPTYNPKETGLPIVPLEPEG